MMITSIPVRHFGAKISLIVGSICCVLFYISVMFPSSWAIFAAQSVFGFGLALVRPASLKFMVKNSSPSALGEGSSFSCFSDYSIDCHGTDRVNFYYLTCGLPANRRFSVQVLTLVSIGECL